MAIVMNMVYRERAAPRCERNEMEEHRTRGGTDGNVVETNLARRHKLYPKAIPKIEGNIQIFFCGRKGNWLDDETEPVN